MSIKQSPSPNSLVSFANKVSKIEQAICGADLVPVTDLWQAEHLLRTVARRRRISDGAEHIRDDAHAAIDAASRRKNSREVATM